MLGSTKSLSAATAYEKTDIKYAETKLDSRLRTISCSTCNINNLQNSTLKKILSNDYSNKETIIHNKENSNQTELRGVQNLRNFWNSRTKNGEKGLSPAKSYCCLIEGNKFKNDKSRALSVHNIAELTENSFSLNSTKDNFYKYKTAATFENNQCKSASYTTTQSHGVPIRLSCNILKQSIAQCGEKIHWTQQVDIMVPKKEESPIFIMESETKMNTITKSPQVSTMQALIDCDNSNENSHPTTEKQRAISSHCSADSLLSLESTAPRRKNASSIRKYSFKTQIKSFYSPRKMPLYSGSNASNKVAKLTQQFNEIIQKDKKVLDEVKRNNGILLSRGGHVYKVIDNSEVMTTETISAIGADKMCKENTNFFTKKNSTVQRAINSFESRSNEKPKVPIKSAQVLRKKKELAGKNKIKNERRNEENSNINLNEMVEKNGTSGTPFKPKGEIEAVQDVSLKINDKLNIRLSKKSNSNANYTTSSRGIISPMDQQTHTERLNEHISTTPKIDLSRLSKNNLNNSSPNSLDRLSENAVQSFQKTSIISNNIPVLESEGFAVNENQFMNELIANISIEEQQDSQEFIAEEKILDALEEVNHKIEILAANSHGEMEYHSNNSFLYQSNSKINNEAKILNEAVNECLINFTEFKSFDNDVVEENSKPTDTMTENISNDERIYEFIAAESEGTMNHHPVVEPLKSFLFCTAKKTFENPKTEDAFNSCENYESINDSCETIVCGDFGYEVCETTSIVAPTRPEKEKTELQRNTTDELPELPNPKRLISKKLFTTVVTNEISSQLSDTGSVYDDDFLYDTVKGSQHCYESLKPSRRNEVRSADTISLTSNGYESINHYRRIPQLCKAESSSTISSDHKTNSLYEVSLANGILAGGHNYLNSYIASSENSDDWVDISDSELNNYDQMGKQQFIVVRERMKSHRSPDWSKRVRDKRLQQTVNNDDDVDHYYEPLFPLGNTNFGKENGDKSFTPNPPKNLQLGQSNHYLSEDYDSFDTDDDIYEDDDLMKKNDSGVDICNVKLPNPPSSKNQVYEFVKKFKNFISIKKSPSDPNKNLSDSIQAKMYENTQFQMEGNEYQSTLKPSRRAPDKPKNIKPFSTDSSKKENIYENTDFHNSDFQITSQSSSENQIKSICEKSLIASNDIAYRSKTKSGKSFKSRLKSFGATSFDTKQMSTLASTRSTFYVTEESEQDSGIFEKVAFGDQGSAKQCDQQIEHQPVTNIRRLKKETSSSNTYRRRTTIGIRPNDPPPPPPTFLDENNASKQRSSSTSWYAECGVFKIQNGVTTDDLISEKQNLNLNKTASNTSWYAEAGLYQTSGISVSSSSGSSGVSTGNEGGIADEAGHHVFMNEPLYQIYNAEKLESMSQEMEDQESTDGYEEIGVSARSEQPKRTRPTAYQLVAPKSGPSRTLWSEIPEVITSEILSTLTLRERSLQEAKFEIITSEASYLKSLNLLRSHFINNHTFNDAILNSRDRRTLFSYIAPVHECSEKLLSELENCWQDNIMLLGLSKSIYTCAENNFQAYISYCEHQGKMDRCLRRLKETNSSFSQNLEKLESDSICCGLTLHSFLMLPMQRITRLPLLIDAVFSKVSATDDEYNNWKLTLAILNKIVAECNEAANRCEQAYEIERISRQLEFPSHIRALAISPAGVTITGAKPRFLVKRGEFVHLIWRGDDAKLTFGKKFTKSNIYAFLFSDLIVLTKRKGEEQFTVFDYCPRNMLTISSGDTIPQLPTKDANQTGKNLILMTLLENFERKTVELILSCPSVSELERWLQATRQPEAETPGEKLYEQWDCPQVIATHEYIATEPDLLSLDIGDVINVSRKLPDGWFSGERIRDGAIGWFPGSFTEEVNSAHVRARNLKQRYRLLTFTATYLELQKRK